MDPLGPQQIIDPAVAPVPLEPIPQDPFVPLAPTRSPYERKPYRPRPIDPLVPVDPVIPVTPAPAFFTSTPAPVTPTPDNLASIFLSFTTETPPHEPANLGPIDPLGPRQPIGTLAGSALLPETPLRPVLNPLIPLGGNPPPFQPVPAVPNIGFPVPAVPDQALLPEIPFAPTLSGSLPFPAVNGGPIPVGPVFPGAFVPVSKSPEKEAEKLVKPEENDPAFQNLVDVSEGQTFAPTPKPTTTPSPFFNFEPTRRPKSRPTKPTDELKRRPNDVLFPTRRPFGKVKIPRQGRKRQQKKLEKKTEGTPKSDKSVLFTNFSEPQSEFDDAELAFSFDFGGENGVEQARIVEIDEDAIAVEQRNKPVRKPKGRKKLKRIRKTRLRDGKVMEEDFEESANTSENNGPKDDIEEIIEKEQEMELERLKVDESRNTPYTGLNQYHSLTSVRSLPNKRPTVQPYLDDNQYLSQYDSGLPSYGRPVTKPTTKSYFFSSIGDISVSDNQEPSYEDSPPVYIPKDDPPVYIPYDDPPVYVPEDPPVYIPDDPPIYSRPNPDVQASAAAQPAPGDRPFISTTTTLRTTPRPTSPSTPVPVSSTTPRPRPVPTVPLVPVIPVVPIEPEHVPFGAKLIPEHPVVFGPTHEPAQPFGPAFGPVHHEGEVFNHRPPHHHHPLSHSVTTIVDTGAPVEEVVLQPVHPGPPLVHTTLAPVVHHPTHVAHHPEPVGHLDHHPDSGFRFNFVHMSHDGHEIVSQGTPGPIHHTGPTVVPVHPSPTPTPHYGPPPPIVEEHPAPHHSIFDVPTHVPHHLDHGPTHAPHHLEHGPTHAPHHLDHGPTHAPHHLDHRPTHAPHHLDHGPTHAPHHLDHGPTHAPHHVDHHVSTYPPHHVDHHPTHAPHHIEHHGPTHTPHHVEHHASTYPPHHLDQSPHHEPHHLQHHGPTHAPHHIDHHGPTPLPPIVTTPAPHHIDHHGPTHAPHFFDAPHVEENYGPPPQHLDHHHPEEHYGPPPEHHHPHHFEHHDSHHIEHHDSHHPHPEDHNGPPPEHHDPHHYVPEEHYGPPPTEHHFEFQHDHHAPHPEESYGPPPDHHLEYHEHHPEEHYGPPPYHEEHHAHPHHSEEHYGPPEEHYGPPPPHYEEYLVPLHHLEEHHVFPHHPEEDYGPPPPHPEEHYGPPGPFDHHGHHLVEDHGYQHIEHHAEHPPILVEEIVPYDPYEPDLYEPVLHDAYGPPPSVLYEDGYHEPHDYAHLPEVFTPLVHPKAFAKFKKTGDNPHKFNGPLAISVALNKYGSPVYVSTPAPYLLTTRTTQTTTARPTRPPPPTIVTKAPVVPIIPEQPLVPGIPAHGIAPPGFEPQGLPGVFNHPHPTAAPGLPGFLGQPTPQPALPPPTSAFSFTSPPGTTRLPDTTTFPGTVPAVPGLVLETATPEPPIFPFGPPTGPDVPFRPAFINSQQSLGPEAITPPTLPPPLVPVSPAIPVTPGPFPGAFPGPFPAPAPVAPVAPVTAAPPTPGPVVTSPQPIFLILNNGPGQNPQLLSLPIVPGGPTAIPNFQNLFSGGLSSTTTPVPITTTELPPDLDLRINDALEAVRSQDGGVSIKPLGIQTISNGFNAVVNEMPKDDSGQKKSIEDDVELFRPFTTRPRVVPVTTTESPVTTTLGQTTTTSVPTTTPTPVITARPTTFPTTASFVRIEHFGQPAIEINSGQLVPSTTISPTIFETKPPKKKTLQETVLEILAQQNLNNNLPENDPAVNRIKEEAVDTDHVRLGPHVVETVKRPQKAKSVEENIHKTYLGQEFVGENTLKAFGNETTISPFYEDVDYNTTDLPVFDNENDLLNLV